MRGTSVNHYCRLQQLLVLHYHKAPECLRCSAKLQTFHIVSTSACWLPDDKNLQIDMNDQH